MLLKSLKTNDFLTNTLFKDDEKCSISSILVVEQNDVELDHRFDNNGISKENKNQKDSSDGIDSCIKLNNIQDQCLIRSLLDFDTYTLDEKKEYASEQKLEDLEYDQDSDKKLKEETIKEKNADDMGTANLNQSFSASSKIEQNMCQTLLDWRIFQLDGIIDISEEELEELSYNPCLNEDLLP